MFRRVRFRWYPTVAVLALALVFVTRTASHPVAAPPSAPNDGAASARPVSTTPLSLPAPVPSSWAPASSIPASSIPAVPTSSIPGPPAVRTGFDGSMPVVEHGSRNVPLVALTFDGDMTEGMLRKLDTGVASSYDGAPVVDELQRMRVPATFFLTGLWAQRYPATARRIAADPLFEVGSHSYSHRAFAIPCFGLEPVPVVQMADDVRRSYELIRAQVPGATQYFRFPGGCHDAAALGALGGVGVTAVQWDVVSGDAFGTSVDKIVRQSVGGASNGSIIVMHATLGNAPLTAKALPRIVEGLRAKGLRPVTISELLAAGP